jgi:hypothetical protein
MKYEYIIRTYRRDGSINAEECVNTLEHANELFDLTCKVVHFLVRVFRDNDRRNYLKVVLIRLSDDEIISEKIYECK